MSLPCNHGAPWYDHDDLKLRRYIIGGLKPPQIALEMGRTENAIVLRAQHLGYPMYLPEESMHQNVNGRFWVIQNGNIKPGERDAHGHAVLAWPGRSIFETKAEAVAAAKEMAETHRDQKFYVMEAVSMFETAKPPIKATYFKGK